MAEPLRSLRMRIHGAVAALCVARPVAFLLMHAWLCLGAKWIAGMMGTGGGEMGAGAQAGYEREGVVACF